MSNYIYVAYDFATLEKELEAGWKRSEAVLDNVKSKANLLAQSQEFQGKTADKIKAYLETTYSIIPELLKAAILALYENFVAYGGKYVALTGADGSSYDERIATEELLKIKAKLNEFDKRVKEVDEKFASEIGKLKSNGDINFDYEPMSSIPSSYNYMKLTLQNLVDGIGAIEACNEFENTQPMLDDVRERIEYLMNIKPSEFDLNAYGLHYENSKTIENYEKMVNEVSAKSESIANAKAVYVSMEETKARDERAKETAWIGVVTDIVCAVATVAATATMGPVGAIVVGAAAGALSSAIHEGLDQYVATGAAIGEMDWGRIGIKALVGGITGAATSAIGAGAGAATKALGSLSSPIIKTAANMGVGIIKNEANVLVRHGGSALETALLAHHEGADWNAAWGQAGDVFRSSLKEDAMKGVLTGVTSNLTGFTGDMKDGFLKSGANILISGSGGMLEYTVTTAIDGKEFSAKDMLASGAKESFGQGIKEIASDLRSDHFPITSWEQEKGNGAAKYLVAFTGGATEKYLSKNGGAFVEALVKGDKDALDNLKFTDKNGRPTSALYNIATGGTQSATKLAYDKHLAPGVTKTETITRQKVDANGNPVFDKNGQPVMEQGERVTTNYGTNKFAGSKKVVAETFTTTKRNSRDGITTKTENTTYYEKGTQIGTGTKTTTTYKDSATGEKVTKTESTSGYTRSDKTSVESSSTSETRYNRDTKTETTKTTEYSSTSNNRVLDHSSKDTVKTSTTTTDKATKTVETQSNSYTTETNRAGNTSQLSETNSKSTSYNVKSGGNNNTHTVKQDTKVTVTKNDFSNTTKGEKTVTNTSSTEDRTQKHTYTEKSNGSHSEQDRRYYSSEKKDDKTVTGYMKTNEGIIGSNRYNPDKADMTKGDALIKEKQDAAVQAIQNQIGSFKPADELLNGW